MNCFPVPASASTSAHRISSGLYSSRLLMPSKVKPGYKMMKSKGKFAVGAVLSLSAYHALNSEDKYIPRQDEACFVSGLKPEYVYIHTVSVGSLSGSQKPRSHGRVLQLRWY